MNPYLQIAREHVDTKDLLIIIAEREKIDLQELKTMVAQLGIKRPAPRTMTEEQELRARMRKWLEEHI